MTLIFVHFFESWINKDRRPIVETKIEEFKDKSENTPIQITDIGCLECLGYGYVEYKCLKGKVMTIKSSTNVGMVLSDYEKKYEDQLYVKMYDQTNKVEESITYERKCESKKVIYEETMIECESKKNEHFEVIKLVEI